MKKIIVPLDFSKQAEQALKVAATLAKAHGAEIFALHMLELSAAFLSSAEGYNAEQTVFLLKMGEKNFKKFLDKPYLKGIKITPIIKHYKVFSEVNTIAEKHDADLVIMGSHGTDGLQEVFIGSNTEKVVRHSKIPVLVIKGAIADFKIERFVFACDFKEASIPALQKAMNFVKLVQAELHLVYINTPGDAFLSTEDAYSRIAKFLNIARLGLEIEIYNDYTVEEGILNYSETLAADVIGIPTHGRKGLAHFFRGSIGEDLVNHSQIPVLTFAI